MANSLLMRPQVAAFRLWRPHFFSSRAFPCSQAAKPCHVTTRTPLLSEKFLVGLHYCVGRVTKSDGCRSLSIRAMTEVNDSSSISSPLMQSMEKK
ncbi:unnamed protein product, partial [Ilex paraguariensis]